MAYIQLQLRRGTRLEWFNANPVLAVAEMAIETDTMKFKIGDGFTSWNSLPYGGISGGVGYTGSSGTGGSGSGNGYTGSLGYAGSSGLGYTGSRGGGYSGSRGFDGLQGNKGDQGDPGPQGDPGDKGNQGEKGYAGSLGYAGSIGAGYTGSVGVGYAGSVGVGYTGSTGTGGSGNGYWGSVGYTGSSGGGSGNGYTGSLGYAGSRGYAGSLGYYGSVGYTGSSGTNGRLTTTFSATFNGPTSVEQPNITLKKSYALLSLTVSSAMWLRVYPTSALRSADASRLQTAEPSYNSGVILEIISTGPTTYVLTPAIIGFNNDTPLTSTAYFTLTNTSGAATTSNITLTYLPLET